MISVYLLSAVISIKLFWTFPKIFLKSLKRVGIIIFKLLNFLNNDIISLFFIDRHINPVASLMTQHSLPDRRLRADPAFQGISPDGCHQFKCFGLIVILKINFNPLSKSCLIVFC